MKRHWLAVTVAVCAVGAPCAAQELVFEGAATGAVLLNGGTVAVAEHDRIHFVLPTRSRTITVGQPFKAVRLIGRTTDGDLVAWDDSLYAAFVLDDRGDDQRVIPFSVPGLGGGEVNFVALLAGDVGLFEEVDPGNPFNPAAGRSRNEVRYSAILGDGTKTVLWEALGKEMVIHRTETGMASAPVIFGYDVLARHVDSGRFLVAQTEGEAASVVGPDGIPVGQVPLPPRGPALSLARIEEERARLMATHDPGPIESILSTILPTDQIREAREAMSAAAVAAIGVAPANQVPPRISDMRVDRQRRVWMRRVVPAGATSAVWDVRPLDGGASQTTELPASWIVFDALDDRVLAGISSETDEIVAVVWADWRE